MTPYQYGQAAAPSNMAFPTAAYMQAAGNAAALQAKGMEALGAGLSKGLDAVTQYLKENRDMHSAVKGGEKFLSFLGKTGVQSGAFSENDISGVNAMLSDPSLSVRDKATLIPALASQMQTLIKYKDEANRQNMLELARAKIAAAGNAPIMQGPSSSVNRQQSQQPVTFDWNKEQPSENLNMNDLPSSEGYGRFDQSSNALFGN